MLTANQLKIIKDEILLDPLGKGYRGNSIEDIASLLNFKATISNPIPQGNVTVYNITLTVSPLISITEFLNTIPFSELLSLSTNPLGKIMYDRLLSLQSNKEALIDVSRPFISSGIDYCVASGLISSNTALCLKGTTDVLDEAWFSEGVVLSRAEELLDQGFVVFSLDLRGKL